MNEQRTFGSLKCMVTDEHGDLFAQNRVCVYVGSLRVSMTVDRPAIDDPAMQLYIEKVLSKKLKE